MTLSQVRGPFEWEGHPIRVGWDVARQERPTSSHRERLHWYARGGVELCGWQRVLPEWRGGFVARPRPQDIVGVPNRRGES